LSSRLAHPSKRAGRNEVAGGGFNNGDHTNRMN
jgi:hypothetical protein